MISSILLSKGQEVTFNKSLLDEKVFATRVWALLGGGLFLLFAIVDVFALTNEVTRDNVLLIRGSVILVHYLLYLVVFKREFFEKYYQQIMLFSIFYDGAALCLMIYISNPSDYAYDLYFAGLMLLITAIFLWAYLPLHLSGGISLSLIFIYVGIKLYMEGTALDAHLSTLISSAFFLGGITVIAALAQIIRDKYLRHNYLLQRSLESALQEKTVEAKDNAYLANHDALTDLPNRRYMTELLEQSLQVAKAKDKVLVLMFMDLNGFKQVNDIYGHAVGDEVLIIVAKRLELAVRSGDYLSRLGGDEFLLGLMMEKENLNEVESMSEKFITLISQPMNIDGLSIKIGASVGIAAYPMHGNNINVLMDIADKKMYQAKKGKTEKSQYSYGAFNQKELEAVVIFPGKSKKTSK